MGSILLVCTQMVWTFFELDGGRERERERERERLSCKCHEWKVDGKVRSYLVKDNPTVWRKLVGRTALLLKVG